MQSIDTIGSQLKMPEPDIKAPEGGRDAMRMEPVNGGEFREMVARHMKEDMGGAKVAAGPSLGDRIINRATNLSSELKQDQQYISKTLEQATRAGDSMQLMKAMMALSDYQMRIQVVSKSISKAVSSVDQLTKLQ
jgi:hypothetical protein